MRARPEQLGWGLTADLAITASGNYFVFDTNGNVYLDFKTVEGDSFQVRRNGDVLFGVEDNGNVSIPGNLTVNGTLTANFSGSITTALTASHLEEQGVALFSPISPTPNYISGGIFYSSSGEWFLS
jgi:hypothetical protein